MPRRLREAKDRERGAWGAGSRARPAAEWRWLTYGYVLVGGGAPRGAVQMALDSADRRDRGAGATLAAMAARGLIEERHDDVPALVQAMLWFRSDTYHVSVHITRYLSRRRPTGSPSAGTGSGSAVSTSVQGRAGVRLIDASRSLAYAPSS